MSKNNCLADDSRCLGFFYVSMMHETEITVLEKYVSRQLFPIRLFLGPDRKLADTNRQVIIAIVIRTIS